MVDAKRKTYFKGDLKAKPPGAITSVQVAASSPLDNYSYETLNLIKRNVRDARDALNKNEDIRNTCHAHARSLCEQVDIGAACYETVSSSCLNKFGVMGDDQPLDFNIYLVHVGFESIKEQARREKFQSIPTTLELPPDEIDLLIEVAPELLHGDPDFQSLLQDLKAQIAD